MLGLISWAADHTAQFRTLALGVTLESQLSSIVQALWSSLGCTISLHTDLQQVKITWTVFVKVDLVTLFGLLIIVLEVFVPDGFDIVPLVH